MKTEPPYETARSLCSLPPTMRVGAVPFLSLCPLLFPSRPAIEQLQYLARPNCLRSLSRDYFSPSFSRRVVRVFPGVLATCSHLSLCLLGHGLTLWSAIVPEDHDPVPPRFIERFASLVGCAALFPVLNDFLFSRSVLPPERFLGPY